MINLFIDKENLLNNSEHINKLKNLREIINSNSSLLSKEKIKLDKSLKLSIELVKLIECLGQNNNKILSSNNNKIENKSQIDEAMAQSLERFGDMKVKKSNKIPSNKSKRKIGINNDDNPKVISKYPNNKVEFVQELAIRYLKPITPEPSGNIIINQLPDEKNSSAPPIILRQQPPRPETPEPLIIREIPPIPPPSNIGPKIITISGKKLPPSRKVVVERLPPLPLKPKSIIIEKWLPYPEVKRKVIYNKTNQPEIKKPKNIIINWETPETEIKTEIRYLGIVKVDPKEYSEKYKDTLKDPNNLPSIVNQVPTPIGLILASDLRNKNENKNNNNRNELILSSIESSSSPKSKFKNLNDTFELSEKRKSTPIEKRKKNDVTFSLSSNLGSIIGKDRVLSFIKENNNSTDFDNLSTFSTVPSTIESGRNQNKDKSCSSTDQQKISTNYSKKKK